MSDTSTTRTQKVNVQLSAVLRLAKMYEEAKRAKNETKTSDQLYDIRNQRYNMIATVITMLDLPIEL